LKEKILAAHRAGIKRVLIPAENEKDIEEIPASVLKTVDLEVVSHMDQVLKKALVMEDPESLFKNSLEQVESKEEPPRFTEKDDEVPGPDILPQ
jgi:ATP-dependent Lon protease